MRAWAACALWRNQQNHVVIRAKRTGKLFHPRPSGATVDRYGAAIAQKPADRPDKYGVFDKHAHMQIKGKNQRQKQAEIPI